MNDPAYTIECARIQDTTAMLKMEKNYFDNCWHSESKTIDKLIEQEPMMFRVCKVDEKVKGYYWVFPLEYSIWNQVITGEIDETEMVKHIKSFDDPDIYLYISSVIVDQTDEQHKKYTKALVYDFGRHFVLSRKQETPDIRAVGAFTISAGGRRLMERSDFSYQGSFKVSGTLVRSYAANRKTLVKQVITVRQKLMKKNIA
ncbi:MAG TPA: hypothetical protein VFC73_07865 [Syntrophomonadaceae bacterium]|nr:hypothetical protein [Syntrophomonadaceae bacterium]